MSSSKNYLSIGALTLAASAIFFQMARTTYSNVQVDKDEQKLSAPFNDTHHIEIRPDVLKSNDGQIHDLSRIRITANQPDQTSYSYNITSMRIEGYELSPEKLPDFLRNKKSLSDIQRGSCNILKGYAPANTTYLTEQAQIAIARRTESVEYLARKICP